RMPRGSERCPECGVEFEPEADDRPWERSGAERRDSEPGRGGTILFLGITSIVLPFLFCIPYFGLFTSLVGLVMGASAWIMGHNDLRKINDHVMAREARGSTYGGMVCGIVGTILCFAGVSIGGWITSQVM
ncbi:MAG: hypothetical protein ACJ8F7_14920, partial [Gemmataceae bacterium]